MTTAKRPEPALEERINGHLSYLIDNRFPVLRQVRIELRAAKQESGAVFLETDVDRFTLLRSAKKRRYLIYVNNRLSENSPADEGLRAILAHELVHIQDYTEMSLWGLIKLHWKCNHDPAYQVAYERQTDLRTMELGFAEGLKAFRIWLYSVLDNPSELDMKKQLYLTPEEIDAWMREHREPAARKRGQNG